MKRSRGELQAPRAPIGGSRLCFCPGGTTTAARTCPGRRTRTPYRVWVSEIMLQQTQVATVERYYDRFMASVPRRRARSPTRPPTRCCTRWSGLGYYGRARNLHRAARRVRDEFGGEVPADFRRARLAARHRPLDGRRHPGAGHRPAPSDPRRQREARARARVPRRGLAGVARGAAPALGARGREHAGRRASRTTRRRSWISAPRSARAASPPAPRCPLGGHVRGASAPASPSSCPAAGAEARAPAARDRRHAGAHARRHVLLEKRPDAGIWGGLWGLPEVAGVDDVRGWCVQAFGRAPARLAVRPVLRHGFTHFDLDMTPVEIEIEPPPRALDGDRWLWYNVREPARVGLAAPVTQAAGLARLMGLAPATGVIAERRKPRITIMPRKVICVLLQTEADGLDYVPYPGELGKRIYENVSKQAWQQWLGPPDDADQRVPALAHRAEGAQVPRSGDGEVLLRRRLREAAGFQGDLKGNCGSGFSRE